MSNATRIWMQHTARIAAVTILLGLPVAAGAQVGHAPESSPYRDVRATQVVSLMGGYLGGEAGKVGVGPTNGPLIGAHFDLLFRGPIALGVGVAAADLDRVVIDPRRGPDDRVKGTFSQSVIMADIGLNLVLTGAKSWHGFVPYLGGSLGLALGGDVPQDSSQFEFATQFLVAPQAGVRWHPAQRLIVRFQGRDVIWRLRYPDTFFQEPETAPGAPPVLDPEINDRTDWTHHWALTLSLGFAIRM